MISAHEIDSKAKEFGIHTSNVQRDYIFGWILNGIYGFSELRNHLVLKGGNCLRKGYFQNTRFSTDLDFSVGYKIELDFLGHEFNLLCAGIQERTGIKFNIERNIYKPKNRVDSNLSIYDVRLYFTDFYGKESKIIISVRIDINGSV